MLTTMAPSGNLKEKTMVLPIGIGLVGFSLDGS
jgi:hypothetical protein